MIQNVGLLGGGTMGAGIAQVAIANGCVVHLLEATPELAEAAVERVFAALDKLADKRKLSPVEVERAKQRLFPAKGPEHLRDSDIVIEAILEELDLKARALAPIIKLVRQDCIFASNTSSLSITQLGDRLGIPRRICGMHFFNPVTVMPLVEVIAGRYTDPERIDRVAELAVSWGKPVVRAKDTPGFVVNRVARPYYLEALRILEEKKASCDAVDLIMTEVAGFRMGPFALMDLVGIDVNYAVTCSIYEQSGQPARFRPSDIQARLVQQRKLGRKSGSGFYDYKDPTKPEIAYRLDPEPFELGSRIREGWEKLRKTGSWDIGVESGYVLGRILMTLMNEAALAEQEGVASAEDIDVAMKLGTNYPRGLLEWAEEIGHERIGSFLRALNDEVDDDRYLPAKRFLF
ncbi:MAG: Fatty acid oxidation complex subunit alpha [Phycisphaerae bacterium]|nr:Fatty acid oxidation complex subunit alpha [Phycisphaerae bacterium]